MEILTPKQATEILSSQEPASELAMHCPLCGKRRYSLYEWVFVLVTSCLLAWLAYAIS